MKNWMLVFIAIVVHLTVNAQREPDGVYNDNIKTIQLFKQNNPFSYPIISLGEVGSMELHFDDLGGRVRNYFYTYELCDANWQPVMLGLFDYIKGFQQSRITQYRPSSIATTSYIHYQALLPERNAQPSKAGNYLLKVFENGDTSRLLFTKRFLVVDPIVNIGAQVQQPFNPEIFRTHQKIQLVISKFNLQLLNPREQLKVVVLQNYRWDNPITGIQPTFIRNGTLEYNAELDLIFPAGKEYRWADLRSFRFQSERVASVNMQAQPFEVALKPDGERASQRYLFFQDNNGFSQTASTDLINPWWQGDYANVKFTFVPSGKQPIAGYDVYLAGQFTNYKYNNATKLQYNAAEGVYETTLLLKQGYYTYNYVTVPSASAGKILSIHTDGNYWETENDYTILVYYRGLGDRHDALIGITTINSRNSRVGF